MPAGPSRRERAAQRSVARDYAASGLHNVREVISREGSLAPSRAASEPGTPMQPGSVRDRYGRVPVGGWQCGLRCAATAGPQPRLHAAAGAWSLRPAHPRTPLHTHALELARLQPRASSGGLLRLGAARAGGDPPEPRAEVQPRPPAAHPGGSLPGPACCQGPGRGRPGAAGRPGGGVAAHPGVRVGGIKAGSQAAALRSPLSSAFGQPPRRPGGRCGLRDAPGCPCPQQRACAPSRPHQQPPAAAQPTQHLSAAAPQDGRRRC
jgi:translation initiation factor IF-2